MIEISVSRRTHGPIFDGRAARAVTAFTDDAKREIADDLYSAVMRNLDTSIRHPTPYYETQIVTERQGNDYVVHDRGIIYGPWLEGVGSRNRTTRFKGYFSFRRAGQQVSRGVPGIAQRVLRRFLPRMR